MKPKTKKAATAKPTYQREQPKRSAERAAAKSAELVCPLALALPTISSENEHLAHRFIRACERVRLEELTQKSPVTGNTGATLADLAINLVASIESLVKAGDIFLARQLPLILERLQRVEAIYGRKLTPCVAEKKSIEQILKTHNPRALVAMVAALNPEWGKPCPEDGNMPAGYRCVKDRLGKPRLSLAGLPFPDELLSIDDAKLRDILLSQRRWIRDHDGKTQEVIEPHPLAAMIQNVIAIHESHAARMHTFVEHLKQGILWGGPTGTLTNCQWRNRKNNPPFKEHKAWMRLIINHLRKVTNDDAMKLSVFRYMLAARSCLYDGQRIDAQTGARLATATPTDIWGQVRTEIRKFWMRRSKTKKPET